MGNHEVSKGSEPVGHLDDMISVIGPDRHGNLARWSIICGCFEGIHHIEYREITKIPAVASHERMLGCGFPVLC